MPMWEFVHIRAGAHGGQMRASEHLELEPPMWVLGSGHLLQEQYVLFASPHLLSLDYTCYSAFLSLCFLTHDMPVYCARENETRQ